MIDDDDAKNFLFFLDDDLVRFFVLRLGNTNGECGCRGDDDSDDEFETGEIAIGSGVSREVGEDFGRGRASVGEGGGRL